MTEKAALLSAIIDNAIDGIITLMNADILSQLIPLLALCLVIQLKM